MRNSCTADGHVPPPMLLYLPTEPVSRRLEAAAATLDYYYTVAEKGRKGPSHPSLTDACHTSIGASALPYFHPRTAKFKVHYSCPLGMSDRDYKHTNKSKVPGSHNHSKVIEPSTRRQSESSISHFIGRLEAKARRYSLWWTGTVTLEFLVYTYTQPSVSRGVWLELSSSSENVVVACSASCLVCCLHNLPRHVVAEPYNEHIPDTEDGPRR